MNVSGAALPVQKMSEQEEFPACPSADAWIEEISDLESSAVVGRPWLVHHFRGIAFTWRQ